MIASTIILVTKVLVFGVFVTASIVAGTHWAVRQRHLTPFNPLARLGRRLGEPFVKPLETRLLRSGGNPASAPAMFFWAALLGGLVLLGLVEWGVGLVLSLIASASAGPRGLLYFAVNLLFSALMLALFLRVVASWFGVSPYSRPMRIAYGLTDWIIDPLRRVIPPLGMVDITPLVAYLMLILARRLLLGLL
jgi:YggT family protein